MEGSVDSRGQTTIFGWNNEAGNLPQSVSSFSTLGAIAVDLSNHLEIP